MSENIPIVEFYRNRISYNRDLDGKSLNKNFKDLADFLCNNLKFVSAVEFSPKSNRLLNILEKKGKKVCAVEDDFFSYDLTWDGKIDVLKSKYLYKNFEWDALEHFDLGIALNVVDYMTTKNAVDFLSKMSECCDFILFSCCEDDDMGSFNEKNKEFWTEKFLSLGFKKDLYITKKMYGNFCLFQKSTIEKSSIIMEYDKCLNEEERNLLCLKNENETIKHNSSFSIEIKQLKSEKERLENRLIKSNDVILSLKNDIVRLQRDLQKADQEVKKNKREFSKNSKHKRSNAEFNETIGEKSQKVEHEDRVVAKDPNQDEIYDLFKGKSLDVTWFMTSNDAINQRKTQNFSRIKFSILTVIQDVAPADQITEMLDSVINQTYENWELCIVDTSNDDTQSQICKKFAADYKNIKYKKYETIPDEDLFSIAYSMSDGDVISLLYQGDILHLSALYDVASAFERQKADFVYTDEANFQYSVMRPENSFYKPEISVSALRYKNYINCFSSFSRELLESAGGFQCICETKHHHDLMLRLADKSQNPVHIKDIRYYKRGISETWDENSEKVIEEHFKNCDVTATVKKNNKSSGVYSVNFKLNKKPKVSIIISNIGDRLILKRCVDSIVKNTNYDNYDIIIVNKKAIIIENAIFDSDFVESIHNVDNIGKLYIKYDTYFDDLIIKNTDIDKEKLLEFEKKLANYKKQKEKLNDEIKEEIVKNKNINFIEWKGDYNRSLMENYAVSLSDASYCVFLDSSSVIKTPDWIEQMLLVATTKRVGIVEAQILKGYGEIKSMGITYSDSSLYKNLYDGYSEDDIGYNGGLLYPYRCAFVSGTCMMVEKDVFEEIGGFSKSLPTYFLYIDICLKYREKKYEIIATPFAKIFHYSSYLTQEIIARYAPITFEEEKKHFLCFSGSQFRSESFYNPHFTSKGKTFVEDPKNLKIYYCTEVAR